MNQFLSQQNISALNELLQQCQSVLVTEIRSKQSQHHGIISHTHFHFIYLSAHPHNTFIHCSLFKMYYHKHMLFWRETQTDARAPLAGCDCVTSSECYNNGQVVTKETLLPLYSLNKLDSRLVARSIARLIDGYS